MGRNLLVTFKVTAISSIEFSYLNLKKLKIKTQLGTRMASKKTDQCNRDFTFGYLRVSSRGFDSQLHENWDSH
jgi:hypothetical protein